MEIYVIVFLETKHSFIKWKFTTFYTEARHANSFLKMELSSCIDVI